MKKYVKRQKTKQVEQALEDQFATGRVLGGQLEYIQFKKSVSSLQFKKSMCLALKNNQQCNQVSKLK